MMRRSFLLLCLALVLTGCTAFSKTKHVASLDPSLSAYTGAIRWGNIDTASAFSRPRNGNSKTVNPKGFAGLKITGYRVRINRIDEQGSEANVSIGFTFYHEDQASIREVNQTTVWYYSDKDNAWYLDGPLPDFSP